MSRFRLLFFVKVVICLAAASNSLADQRPTTFGQGAYCGIATEVNLAGRFRIDGKGCLPMLDTTTVLRLYGVIPNPKVLNDLIEGKRISCTIKGVSEVQGGKRTEIVSCGIGPIDGIEKGRGGLNLRVEEYLLMIGEAIEICGETGGLLGTCTDRWWPREPMKP